MAYLSDVDLATLHKSRLEERVQYRLSAMWTHAAEQSREQSLAVSSSTASPPAMFGDRETANYRAASTASTDRTSVDGTARLETHPKPSDIVNNNVAERSPKESSVLGSGTSLAKRSSFEQKLTTMERPLHQQQLLQQQYNFNGHVIRPRIRSSNSMSSSSSTASNYHHQHHASSSSSGGGGKHVEWSDDDHLHDDGYFSSDTRRRRSGTWPRTRSLNAPSPFQQFGPCGRIMKNSAMVMQIQDPASQRLTWYKPPLAVLVIKKVRDSKVLQPFVQLVEWLIHEKHMVVWVEAAILDDALLTGDKRFTKLQDKLITFKDGRDDLTDKIDFIICLGGDGTLLYASLLFQKSVPPVMAFHLGSLGFLTPFQFDNFQEQVTNVLEGHAALTLRSRLRCIIVRKDKTEQEISTFKSSQDPSTNILVRVERNTSRGERIHVALILNFYFQVLNEVVIDRGLSSYLSNIDLFLDGKHITSVQGDGLIVSTPTGSTAYSAAAGASMIHPSVPAILVTPICPHSLSFRPIVLPAGVELKIAISPDSRNSSWVSFDGRNRQELLHGDSLHVTTSIYPVPSICAQDQIADWFDSLAECLHWNVRKRQKCLDELSDLTGSGTEDSAIDDIVRGMENLEN
ncbi:NAD kinase-like isoform X1 [Anopheles funestus]|uniref:NAD kinase-like isoform X1 n=1 Tax=Anopheles funestus TaxID=62324 RepID=UPI0020C66B0C|nr:NAD kinase-like isoform X1 [Anopheles funestus]